MESVGEYWERKQAELELLGRAARLSPATVSSGAELLAEKQRLRAGILARVAIEQPRRTESNLYDSDERFSYGYQRFDLRPRTRRFFNDVYPLDVRGGISLGVWSGSGMAAIAAALRTLHARLRAPRRILFAPDAYFESRRLISKLDRFLPNSDDDRLLPGDFFYLDSVTDDDHFALLNAHASIQALEMVVFDTTCYDVGSPLIDRVVARCRAENVPLLCLRSHLKIDLLATEYARLGSAALLLPPRPSRALTSMAQTVRFGIIEELATSGGMPTTASFWPLAGDPAFQTLNARRNARMVEAQRRLGAALGIAVPHHGCFVLLHPRSSTEVGIAALTQRLIPALQRAGIEARSAPSFGYDLCGLTHIRRLRPVLRLAVPDFADDDIDRMADVIRNLPSGPWIGTDVP